jgi:Cdc6-like AAA superfamily ATPase
MRENHSNIRTDMLEIKSSITALVGTVEAQISQHVTRIAGSMQSEMERASAKLKKEVVERRRLHNLVQELKGNIRVFCRVRPMSQKDTNAGQRPAVTFPGEGDVTIDVSGKVQAFQYDMVFDPASTQEAVFEETQPLVISVLDGFNVCIFAYGQTGSGKTHTMQASTPPPSSLRRAETAPSSA